MLSTLIPPFLSFRLFLKELEDLVNQPLTSLKNLESLKVFKNTADKSLEQEVKEPQTIQWSTSPCWLVFTIFPQTLN